LGTGKGKGEKNGLEGGEEMGRGKEGKGSMGREALVIS